MNKMARENIVTKLERGGGGGGGGEKKGNQRGGGGGGGGGGNEKTWRPDGMGESEEACLTITTKRYKSFIEICFEVHDIA